MKGLIVIEIVAIRSECAAVTKLLHRLKANSNVHVLIILCSSVAVASCSCMNG